MAERFVTWRAIADFSKIRQEAAKSEAALEDLEKQNDDTSKSNARLSQSEKKLAKDTATSADSTSSSMGKVSKAKAKAAEASVNYTKATNQETLATAKNNVALAKAQKAKQDEAAASQAVAASVTRLKNAKEDIAKTDKKVADATLNYSKVLAKQEHTVDELEAAEKRLNKAKSESENANKRLIQSANSLQKAQLRQASIQANNILAEKKAEEASVKSAQVAADKRQAIADREERARQSSLKSLQTDALKEDAARTRASERRIRLAESEAGKIAAINANIARTRQQTSTINLSRSAGKSPTGPSVSPVEDKVSSADLNSLQRVIRAKQASAKITADEALAANRLTRAEDALTTARAREASALNSLDKNQTRLNIARAQQASVVERIKQQTASLATIEGTSGKNSLEYANASKLLADSHKDLANASTEVEHAMAGAESATKRVGIASATSQSAVDRFAQSFARAEKTFRTGGSSGNIFTRMLDRLASGFDDAKGAGQQFGSVLGLLKLPIIAGGIYELLSALSALVSGLFALASAIGPAVGGLAAIGPILFGIGTAVGTVKAAFSGVSNVLKLYTTAQNKSAAAGTSAANTARSNAQAIANAQYSLAQARAQVGITAKQGAEQIQAASRNIVQADRAVKDSQESLTQARKDALKNIQDLKQAVIDASLAEQGANLGLAQSKEDLQRVLNDPTSTRLQREQAQLAVDNAENQAKVAKKSTSETKKASRDATSTGVEGSKAVKDAKLAERDAIYQAAKARQDEADTIAQVARSNAAAVHAVSQAQQALADAQRNATQATDAGTKANDAYNAALAKLPKSAQKFVEKLISMKKYWTQLRTAAANGLFPGLTKALGPLPKLVPVLSAMFYSMGRVLGNLAVDFSKLITSSSWLKSFATLSDGSNQIIHTLGKTFLYLLDAFRAIAVAAIPMTEALTKGTEAAAKHLDKIVTAPGAYERMVAWFDRARRTLHQLGIILKNIAIGIFNTGKAAGDSGRDMLDSIQKITDKWAKWTATVDGQNSMKKYFDGVRANVKEIDSLLGRLGKAFIDLGDNKGLAPILKALHNLWMSIKNAFSGSNIQQSVADIINNIAAALKSMSGLGSIIMGFVQGMVGVTAAFAWFVSHPTVAHIIADIALAFGAFKALKLGAAIFQIDKLARGLSSFTKAALGAEGGSRVVAGLNGTSFTAAGAARVEKNGGNALGKAAGAAPAVAGALIGNIKGWGAKAATALGPWGIAIAAIVTAITVMYIKWKWFRDQVNRIIKPIGAAVMALWTNAIYPAFKSIGDFISKNHQGFTDLFNSIGDAIKSVASVFVKNKATFKKLFMDLASVIKFVWKVAQPIFKLLGFAIKNTVGLIVVSIKIAVWILNVLAETLSWLIDNIVSPVLTAIAVAFTAVGKAISWLIRNTILPVLNLWAASMRIMWKVIQAVWGFIKAAFAVAVKVIWTAMKIGWKIIAGVILAPIVALILLFKYVWSKIGGTVKAGWNAIWTFLKTAWGVVKSVVGGIWHAITGVIGKPIADLWAGIKSGWLTIWGWLQKAWSGVKGVASGIWHSIVSAISTAFGKIEDVFSTIWDNVKSIFATAINFVTQDILNPLIRAINAVTGLFGIGAIKQIGKIGDSAAAGNSHAGAPGASSGGGGGNRAFAKGGVLPGYTPGRDPHEFVSNTGLKLNLSGGEGILVPEATRALGGKRGIDTINRQYSSRLPSAAGSNNYAGGGVIGSPDQQKGYEVWSVWRLFDKFLGGMDKGISLGGIGDSFAQLAEVARKGLASLAKGTFEAAEVPIRAAANAIQVPMVKKLIGGLLNKVNSGVYHLIAGHQDEGKVDPQKEMRYSGPINGKKKRNEVMASGFMLNNMADTKAFKDPQNFANATLAHNSGLVGALNTIIQFESGWNASAQNNVDSNAKAGHPSQGLMQTIKGTYDAYKNPNLDRGMKDAVSNVAAGINYSNSRYGGLNNVPGVVATGHGGGYVGYNKGGIVQNFHRGGVVGNLNKKSNNWGLGALAAQAGLNFTQRGSRSYAGLPDIYKRRLAGISKSSDVVHPNLAPYVQSPLSADSPTSKQLMNWVDSHDPKNYTEMWTKQPHAGGGHNSFRNRNPLLPILSFIGGKNAWTHFREKKDAAKWQSVIAADKAKYNAAKKDKSPSKAQKDLLADVKKDKNYFSLGSTKKRHPKTAASLLGADKEWVGDLNVLSGATHNELSRVATLRNNYLKMSGSGNNDGLISSDMINPLDHAAAHALGKEHPADWQHPWSGPVTAAESALADQDRSNALNVEWYKDLNTIAGWGYTYLVDNLINKGITDGLSLARSAVKDKKTAQQLNDAIKAGAGTGLPGGVSVEDETMILKIIAKLGSGTASKPFGLRDISSYLQAPDYAPVNLYNKMLAQLNKLPAALTGKFKNDVDNFRKGIFYANTGAIVPGSRSVNKDTVPAMLTPGEGVLNQQAVAMIGEQAVHSLNNGIKPQMFANGGIALAPNVGKSSMLATNSMRADTTSLRSMVSQKTTNSGGDTIIHTEINNPVGEASVYSMNKAQRRNAALGIFDRNK